MKDGKSADLISGYFASRPLEIASLITKDTAELEAVYYVGDG